MISRTPAGGVLLDRRSRAVVVAVIVGVFLAIVAPITADASTPRGSAAPARAGGPQISWTACGPRLECASVPVPLDWAHPGGPTITLAVIRHLASRPDQRIGSLFVNPGGPGDTGSAMSPSAARSWTPSPRAASMSSAGTSAAAPEGAPR
jgi:hypothetical protein